MKKDEYDVIIIGAGIGGLICANYLATCGKKVLVVDKNSQPGGYCSSFYNNGCVIDGAIHALQDCNKGSILSDIFLELKIDSKIKLIRGDPSDTIITTDHKINVYNSYDETLKEFVKNFPKEKKSLNKFFSILVNTNVLQLYAKYKNFTYQQVLNSFFRDRVLKRIFGVFLSNIGSVPSDTSAYIALLLTKQFILSGGYYPLGGAQVIPDVLAHRLQANGGDLLLNNLVSKIYIKSGKAIGINSKNGNFYAKHIVSNADFAYTINKLLSDSPDSMVESNVLNYTPALSIFMLYVMVRRKVEINADAAGIWCIPSDKYFSDIANQFKRDVISNRAIFYSIISKLDNSIVSGGKDYFRIMINTEYHDKKFWMENRKRLKDVLLTHACNTIPNLRDDIICVATATPISMYNYSLNYNGSISGWLNSPKQVNDPIVSHLPNICGLYFVGHWITRKYGNGGVAMAADSGRKVAKMIAGNKDE